MYSAAVLTMTEHLIGTNGLYRIEEGHRAPPRKLTGFYAATVFGILKISVAKTDKRVLVHGLGSLQERWLWLSLLTAYFSLVSFPLHFQVIGLVIEWDMVLSHQRQECPEGVYSFTCFRKGS